MDLGQVAVTFAAVLIGGVASTVGSMYAKRFELRREARIRLYEREFRTLREMVPRTDFAFEVKVPDREALWAIRDQAELLEQSAVLAGWKDMDQARKVKHAAFAVPYEGSGKPESYDINKARSAMKDLDAAVKAHEQYLKVRLLH